MQCIPPFHSHQPSWLSLYSPVKENICMNKTKTKSQKDVMIIAPFHSHHYKLWSEAGSRGVQMFLCPRLKKPSRDWGLNKRKGVKGDCRAEWSRWRDILRLTLVRQWVNESVKGWLIRDATHLEISLQNSTPRSIRANLSARRHSLKTTFSTYCAREVELLQRISPLLLLLNIEKMTINPFGDLQENKKRSRSCHVG